MAPAAAFLVRFFRFPKNVSDTLVCASASLCGGLGGGGSSTTVGGGRSNVWMMVTPTGQKTNHY